MKKIILCIAIIMFVLKASAVFSEVLLSDNFNTANTANINTDLSTRQTGSSAGTYLVSSSHSGTNAIIEGFLRISGYKQIYLNKSFYDYFTTGKSIHYSFKLKVTSGWATVYIGTAGAWFGNGAAGLGIEQSSYEWYVDSFSAPGVKKGANGVWTGNPNGNGTNWHKYDIYITQDIGHKDVVVNLDNNQVYSGEAPDPYWTGTYLNICSSSTSYIFSIDDICITGTPDQPAESGYAVSGKVGNGLKVFQINSGYTRQLINTSQEVNGVSIAPDGNIYYTGGFNTNIYKAAYTGNGVWGLETIYAAIPAGDTNHSAFSLTAKSDGTVFVGTYASDQIYRIDPGTTPTVTQIVGAGLSGNLGWWDMEISPAGIGGIFWANRQNTGIKNYNVNGTNAGFNYTSTYDNIRGTAFASGKLYAHGENYDTIYEYDPSNPSSGIPYIQFANFNTIPNVTDYISSASYGPDINGDDYGDFYFKHFSKDNRGTVPIYTNSEILVFSGAPNLTPTTRFLTTISCNDMWIRAIDTFPKGNEAPRELPVLAARYNFSEGTGNILHDISGNGNNGVISGAQWVSNGGSWALDFDGINDFVDCGSGSSLDLREKVSFAVWIKPEAALGPGEAGIVGKSYSSYFMTSYYGTIWSYINTGGNNVNTSMNMGSWQFIVSSYDGNTLRLYLDGKLITERTLNLGINTGGKFWIGTSDENFSYTRGLTYHGQIAEVSVYNGALNQEDIDNLISTTNITGAMDIAVEPVPLRNKIMIEAGKRGLGPAGVNALSCFELYRADIPNSPMLASVMRVPFDSDGKVYTQINVTGITAGPYLVKAYAVNPANNVIIGVPNYSDVQWPLIEEFPNGPAGARRLNNLVTEVLNVPNGVSSFAYSFYNPRKGWIYIANSGSTSVTLTSLPSNTSRVIQLSTKYNGANEAMLELPEGNYTVSTNSPIRLIVRAIPEIIYSAYGANPQIPPLGPLAGDFEKQYMFKHVNIIQANSSVSDPFASEWTSMGKKWLLHSTVPREVNGQPITVAQAADFIASTPGFTNVNAAGSIFDEFGNSEPVCSIYADAIRLLKQNPLYADRVCYPWGNSMWDGPDGIDFMNALAETGGKLAMKHYLCEQNTEMNAWKFINNQVVDTVKPFKLVCEGSPQNIVLCFGNFSAPVETLDTIPNVNYLVYLDMQFQVAAVHPDMVDLGGLMCYLSAYSDEEVIRWCGMLFRHYAIEGSVEPLTNDPYILNNLQNSDFNYQGEDWTLSGAEPMSILFDVSPGFNWLAGRYPPPPTGDTVIILKRSVVKPNSFSQTIRNLEPGKLYSFEMISGDYNDMSLADTHAVSIDISNVTMVPAKCFQYVFHSCYSHNYGPYNTSHYAWMNYYNKVFKANNTTATLTVSDWLNSTTPGGPFGQKLMFNFIQVEPYFAEGNINGTVNLLNYDGDISAIPLTIELNGTPYLLDLTTNGDFSILNVPDGIYDVYLKASHWLAKFTANVNVSGDTNIGISDLINGDVVENNEVDFSDINAVRAAYGSFPGDDTWNEQADVDGSGEVDFSDINIVRNNYGEIGE